MARTGASERLAAEARKAKISRRVSTAVPLSRAKSRAKKVAIVEKKERSAVRWHRCTKRRRGVINAQNQTTKSFIQHADGVAAIKEILGELERTELEVPRTTLFKGEHVNSYHNRPSNTKSFSTTAGFKLCAVGLFQQTMVNIALAAKQLLLHRKQVDTTDTKAAKLTAADIKAVGNFPGPYEASIFV